MSATGQPPAESEGTPPAESGTVEAPQETTAPAQPEGFDRIYQRMDEMGRQQAQLVDSLSQLMQPEEENALEYYDDEGGLTEEGAQALISDLVAQQVQEQLAPREAQALKGQRDDAYDALCDEYPELQKNDISGRVLGEAVAWANRIDPSIIDRPEFVDVIESFYKAMKFEELRSQQEDQQPRQVILESGGGAARQQQPKEVDWQKRVIEAAQKDGPRI